MVLSDSFCRTVRAAFVGGGEWLERLPALIADFERRWGVRIGRIFPLSYNFVAAATAHDGTEYILKLGVPRAELQREITALQLYAGRGIANLIASDAAQGALLLERLRPGSMLDSVTDPDQAAQIGARVMAALWQPLPAVHPFRSVREWANGLQRLRVMFDGGTGPLPEAVVDSAENIFHDLFTSAADPVLLHGDLHHYNILSSQRGNGWLAIDPKGMAGERAYETGTFIRNHLTLYAKNHNRTTLLDHCIAIFAEQLNLDRQRIRQQAFAQAVLSAWWSIEDGVTGWETAIEVVEIIENGGK
ncbi:MAG TPA: aminoglycoside/hydroxyurea antibiotic resistance kinase [Anaerolineae bacterium]|nr:aminoglycoside/hydroxyurea antibiotic resistance kinase [Anaerolineae bacterium]